VFKNLDQAVGVRAVDSASLPAAMTHGAVETDFVTD
jgi:hypothetical protein